MSKVVVIGGGITGLSAMFELQKFKREHNLDVELILVEQNERLGGKLRTVLHNDFKIESGADSIVANKKDVLPLIEELNLGKEVVYNATGTSYIHTNNKLYEVPEDSVFGIPMSIEALNNSTLVSEQGKKEVLKDFESENTIFTKDDSIGAFLEHFLGKEIVENQIAPILSGVYSGNLYDLSISSTLPYLLDYKNQYGSIIRGLSENQQNFKKNASKKFLSFKNGLSTLIDKLESELTDVTIIKGIETTSVEKMKDQYVLSFKNYEKLIADHVVLSIPNTSAQRLLNDERLNQDFNSLKNSSLISIYLGFDILDSKLPNDGTGFIVSKDSDLLCNACTWTSRKWPNTSEQGKLLVRLFYKSSILSYDHLNSFSEDELIRVAMRDIQNGLGFTEEPISVEVTKWTDLMPNYTIEHPQSIHSLNDKLANLYPNIHIAGCSYYGVGIGDCITNGKEIATLIAGKFSVPV